MFTETQLIEDDWEILKRIIHGMTGFNCEDYSDSFLKRRIDVRLRALSLNGYADYIGFLKINEGESGKLLKELTIHVTHFFRNLEFYNSFIDNVIPNLISNISPGNNKIRIWSAGCSTGEEPYTIVICFLKKLGMSIEKYDLKVIATDYDEATITNAKAGVYEESQFRETSEQIKNSYFTKVDDVYKIKDFVKDKVEFHSGNILKESPQGNFNIIFCRNTVIYFGAKAKENLYVKFFHNIQENGFLVLGKTESMIGESKENFDIFDLRNRIYKVKDANKER